MAKISSEFEDHFDRFLLAVQKTWELILERIVTALLPQNLELLGEQKGQDKQSENKTSEVKGLVYKGRQSERKTSEEKNKEFQIKIKMDAKLVGDFIPPPEDLRWKDKLLIVLKRLRGKGKFILKHWVVDGIQNKYWIKKFQRERGGGD